MTRPSTGWPPKAAVAACLAAAAWLAGCGGRSGLIVCANGSTRPCEDACGAGVQVCADSVWLACQVPVATRTCTNDCGPGEQTCSDGAWSACDVPVARRICSNDCGQGDQTCSNGAWSACEVPPASRPCSNMCGPGKQTCAGGVWQPCDAPTPGPPTLIATVRDFRDTHPDFERIIKDGGVGPGYRYNGLDLGIVEPDLDAMGLPVYAGNPTTPTTSGKQYFDEWYRDTPDNAKTTIPIQLAPASFDSSRYYFDDQAFFPIDNELFGNQGRPHNGDFTLELSAQFRYGGGEILSFMADDDLWVFLNGHLGLDLGGTHTAREGSIDLDALSADAHLARGNSYTMRLFFAERQVASSVLRINVPGAAFAACP